MLTWEESSAFESNSRHCLAHYQIIRRNEVVPFEPNKIATAMIKVFMTVSGASVCTQSILGSWFHGFWRFLKPSKASAHVGESTAHLKRHSHFLPLQAQSRADGFFGSSKPNMRNAP
jgi:hypothetical protein